MEVVDYLYLDKFDYIRLKQLIVDDSISLDFKDLIIKSKLIDSYSLDFLESVDLNNSELEYINSIKDKKLKKLITEIFKKYCIPFIISNLYEQRPKFKNIVAYNDRSYLSVCLNTYKFNKELSDYYSFYPENSIQLLEFFLYRYLTSFNKSKELKYFTIDYLNCILKNKYIYTTSDLFLLLKEVLDKNQLNYFINRPNFLINYDSFIEKAYDQYLSREFEKCEETLKSIPKINKISLNKFNRLVTNPKLSYNFRIILNRILMESIKVK